MSDERPPPSHALARAGLKARPESLPDSVMERSLALVRRNLFQEGSPLLTMGRFELRRTLGHGGMGVAYEAYDPQRRELVALKTLQALGPSGLFMLKREFRSLARLSHRNLVVLHDLSVEADEAFFSMELVDGVDFVSYVRRDVPIGGRPPEARLLDAFVQLCEGVHALHDNGKLHRDLKPSNVLVTAEGRVVLLDFGLVHELGDGPVAVGGTPAYMAPEQQAGEVGTHSDFFAIGRILDEALHGRTVPNGRRNERRRHAHRPWDALCSRLLSTDPGARPGFDEIVSTVRAPRAATRKARRRGASDLFVGRESELAALRAAFAASEDGPVVVSLRGETGIGKSTLVRRFLAGLSRERKVLVLRGACHERESVPFKALDSVIDDLTQHLVENDSVTLTVDERAALRLLFPVFGCIPSFAGITSPNTGDLMTQRARAFTAFSRLMGQLARARRLVVCIDDAQWSDTDSGHLLSALLSDADAPPLMLVMIDRCERAADNPALTALRARTDDEERPLALVELPLGPLGDRETVALATHFADLTGGDDARVARLAGESRGNPLLLSALAGWAAAAPVWSSDAISLDAALGQRLSIVSDLSKSVLSMVVLAGFPIASSVIADALELDGVPYAALDQLRAARLIHTRKARELLVAPDHGTVAEAVLRRIDAAERTALHLRLACALERVEGVSPELLVEQYAGAERFETAATYARRAADAALFGLAFASAAGLYQRALALGTWSAADEVALHASLARALEHSGSWQAAVDVYLRAARLTSDPLQALMFEGCAAEHLSYHGRFDEAALLLRRGYAVLGLHWPKSRLGLRLRVGTQLLGWLLRSWLRIRPKRLAMSREEGRARFKYLSGIGRTLDNQDIERSLYNALLCFAESERLDEPHLHARARGARALLPLQLPLEFLVARGVRELAAAGEEAARLGDAEGHLYLECQLAVMLYLTGQTRPALHAARRAEARLRELPRRPIDLDAVMAIIPFTLLDLGELRELSRFLGAFEREAKLAMRETGVWFVLHPARFALSLATADDVDGVRAELAEIERSGLTKATLLTARWAHAQVHVELAIYAGDADVAQAELEKHLRLLRAPGVRFMDDYVRLVRARIALMAAASEVAPRARARLLRRASKDAAVLVRRRGRMATGPAQLLQAAIAFQKGQIARALKELASARARAEAAEHKLLAAVVRICEEALRGDDEGRAIAEAAFRVIEAEGVRNPHRWVASVACGFQGLLGHADDHRGEHARPGASQALARG